jgi:hypothetical protein
MAPPVRATASTTSPPPLVTLAHPAGKLVTFGYVPGSKVSIDGTSTIHDWTVEGSLIGGVLELEAAFLTNQAPTAVPSLQGKALPKVNVFIPVSSLHNKGGYPRMDEVMGEAMRAAQHQRITYKLLRLIPKGAAAGAGSSARFASLGELVVAGVTNLLEMEVALERLDSDLIKWTGEQKLKMTDFKIAPPTLTFPPIKTGDEVTIRFQWLLRAKTRAQ